MTMDALKTATIKFLKNDPANYVAEEDAISPDLAGMKLYFLPADFLSEAQRAYTGPFDYCNLCGKCQTYVPCARGIPPKKKPQ